jgi:ribosomal protein S18 acetylase RimI-like enzyme
MNPQITIQQATATDKEFIIESILEAEKSGTSLLSYSAIFNLSEKEFIGTLNNILDEDITGQELCLSGFLIAKVEGKNASAICSWVEGEVGQSNMLKANTLMYFIGKEKFIAASESIMLLDEVSIPREEGAIQLECIYTKKEFRGLGLSKKLIAEHIAVHKKRRPDINKAQIILMANNDSAVSAYEKAGFHIAIKKKANNPNVSNLLPGNSKLLMEKII